MFLKAVCAFIMKLFASKDNCRSHFEGVESQISAIPFTMSFDIYMKWKLDYSLFAFYIQILLNSFRISNKSGKHTPEFSYNKYFIHLLTIKPKSIL